MSHLRAELESVKCDLAHTRLDHDAALKLVEMREAELEQARAIIESDKTYKRLEVERDLAAWQEAAAKKDEALKFVSEVERKCSDAWAGGIGDADLNDLSRIGNVARRALSLQPSPNRYAEK